MYDTSHNNFRIHRYLHAYELVLYCRRFLYAANTMGSQNVQWRDSDIDPLYAWMLHLKLHSCINFDSFSMCLKRPGKMLKIGFQACGLVWLPHTEDCYQKMLKCLWGSEHGYDLFCWITKNFRVQCQRFKNS